jgi:CRP-like cAMP-binding protein
VHLKIYSPNEFITREGLEEDSMFVIFRGSVKVQVKEGDVQKTIAILQEGDFFGEMGLFTGEPRTASVVASEETKVLQIRKDAIKPLLDANPQLVEAFSKVIAERKIALANRPKTEKVEELAEEESKGLISAIKRFFGIN